MEPDTSTPHATSAQRTSTRVRLQLPVMVSSLDQAVPFFELCYTLVVNLQGCALRMSRAMGPGTPVRLSELPGGRDTIGFVANCVPLGSEGKFWVVGVQLADPGNYWGIPNPPADWSASADDTTVTAQAGGAASPKTWPYNLDPAGSRSTRPK